ncbi:OadG-related small transporter subunit [Lutispora sp.]|nr:OadG-related small transporter subunit [Lutispora sp.]MEA4964135.1 OadG-related small transporter subunit [Lutispora sp.]
MNIAVFYESLKVMVNGMVGIFVVIIIFYMLITILTKIFPENR